MFIERWKIIAVALISFTLVNIFFLGIKPNEFLFLHDELLALNSHDAVNGLFIRNANELNVDNTTILTVTLLDRLYYFLGFSLGISLQNLEKIFYFIKLFILILIPYVGFKKFAENINVGKVAVDDFSLWLVTFLYAFNTYTVIYWHGNAFQFSLLLCYALAPLAIYYFKLIISQPTPNLKLLMTEALIFMAMSFSVYFFAVFLIVLIAYYVSVLVLNPHSIKNSLISLIKLTILSIPLFSIFIPMLQVLIFGGGTVNATGGETFTNIQGGLLYQLFLWFSWGIYSNWAPKNIFTFNDYYKSFIYLLSPLAIFGVIFYGIKNKLKDKEIIYFLIILIITLILVKGPQPPFQEIYMQLLKYFPPFRVFRSPDNKFGFGITLALSFLLLLVSNSLKKRAFVGAMVFIILVQGFPILSGIAIKGQNTEISSDRIIHIPDTYKELANYLTNDESQSGYLMPIPPTSFGHFILSPTEKHLGQDLIPKLTNIPYLTPDQYSSMPVKTYTKIQDTIEGNSNDINDFPIEYFLIRKDLEFITSETGLSLINKPGIEKAFENSSFILYRNKEAAKVVEAENAVVTFNKASPVEYKVTLNRLNEDSSLILNTNFDSGWNIYIKDQTTNRYKFLDTRNSLYNDYSNIWSINRKTIIDGYSPSFYKTNEDGTISVDLSIYYQPQTNFYVLAGITVIFAIIYATFIIAKHDK